MPKDKHHWSAYEAEVSHYYQHEEGVSAQSYDPQGAPTIDPKPPRFPPGSDYWLMWTCIDRLREADKFMPIRVLKVSQVESEVTKNDRGEYWCSPSQRATQRITGVERPSASMVLRAAYGVKAARYDDQAPDGQRLLREARAAYVKAALVVPARKRPGRMQRLQDRLDRILGI